MTTPIYGYPCPECDGFAAVVIRDAEPGSLTYVQCPVCCGTGTVSR